MRQYEQEVAPERRVSCPATEATSADVGGSRRKGGRRCRCALKDIDARNRQPIGGRAKRKLPCFGKYRSGRCATNCKTRHSHRPACVAAAAVTMRRGIHGQGIHIGHHRHNWHLRRHAARLSGSTHAQGKEGPKNNQHKSVKRYSHHDATNISANHAEIKARFFDRGISVNMPQTDKAVFSPPER